MPFTISGTSPEYTVAFCIEKSWTVYLACDGCDRAPIAWLGDELARLPPETTLGNVAARAKCSACGSTSGRLYTRQGHWGARAAMARG